MQGKSCLQRTRREKEELADGQTLGGKNMPAY